MTSNQLGMTGEDGHFAITLTFEITRATGDAGKKPMRIVSLACQNFTFAIVLVCSAMVGCAQRMIRIGPFIHSCTKS